MTPTTTTTTTKRIYCEKQQGDLCRLHAINNIFQYNAITIPRFQQLLEEYASEATDEPRMPNTHSFCNVPNTNSFLDFLLQQLFKKSSFTIGQYEMNEYKKRGIIRTLMDCIDMSFPRFFVCEAQHVFCVILSNGKWLKIDSVTGVSATDLTRYETDHSLTLVFPWSVERCVKGIAEMQALLRKRFKAHSSSEDIRRLIIADQSQREPDNFGLVQVWMRNFFKYVVFVYKDDARVAGICSRYVLYETGQKNDILNALQHLPRLILFILHFD